MPANNSIASPAVHFKSVKFSSADYCIRQTSDIFPFYVYRRRWIRKNVPYLSSFNRYTSRLPFPTKHLDKCSADALAAALVTQDNLPSFAVPQVKRAWFHVDFQWRWELAQSEEWRAGRLAGLSTCHILRKRDPDILIGQMTLQGGVVKLERPKLWARRDGQTVGAVRGRVVEFTRKSQHRLLLKVATTKGAAHPDFATLTYPGEYDPSPAAWKHHLVLFYKRLRYQFSRASMVWKLEPQDRGAPHYHLLVWGLDTSKLVEWAQGYDYTKHAGFPEWMKEVIDRVKAGRPVVDVVNRRGQVSRWSVARVWFAVNWYEVVGSGDIKHLSAGTEYDKIRSWGGVVSYAAKYLGKNEQMPEGWRDGVGRFWGVYGRDTFPAAPVTYETLPLKVVNQMIRYAKRHMGIENSRGASWGSLSFLADAEQWRRLALGYEEQNAVCWTADTERAAIRGGVLAQMHGPRAGAPPHKRGVPAF